jgi:hypothetical protein
MRKPQGIPTIHADFNAIGLMGRGDRAIYGLDKNDLERWPAKHGTLIFVWDESDESEIIGQLATLEFVQDGDWSAWRAQPISSTVYQGPQTFK